MKAFLNILWITFLVAAIGIPDIHSQQVYVKKDTTMTFSVGRVDTVAATYTWNLSPVIAGFVPSTDTAQTIKFSGNFDDMFTLSVTATGKYGGCASNPKSLEIKLYENVLPVNVSWLSNPTPLCPDTGLWVDGEIKIENFSGGEYSIEYQIDNGKTTTSSFNTNSPAVIRVKEGLYNASADSSAYFYVRILKFISKDIIITYGISNAPTMTIEVKPVPIIEEIQYK